MTAWFQKEKTETSFPIEHGGIVNNTVWEGISKKYRIPL